MLIWDNKYRSKNWEGYTVILPAIGFGEVGQKGCELLVTTLKIKPIGSIFLKALAPNCESPSIYNESTFTSASDVYTDEGRKLLIVQVRLPIFEHYLDEFHTDLMEIVKGCSKLILLTSTSDNEKKIQAPPYAYKATEDLKEKYTSQLASSGWPEFTDDTIYRGGTALESYKTFTADNIPVFLLLKYIGEGNTCQHAVDLVRELDKLFESDLKIATSGLKLRPASSWRLIYGYKPRVV